MEIKTTKEIIESSEAEEYFDIQQDLECSEIPKEESLDYDRLNSWCINHNKKWIDYSKLKEIIVQMGFQNKSLMDLYNKIFYAPTIDGEQINKTGGRPNEM